MRMTQRRLNFSIKAGIFFCFCLLGFFLTPIDARSETPVDDKADEFDEFDEKPLLELSSEIMQKLGVRTSTLTRKHITKTLRAPGIVAYDETTIYTLNTKFSGWIEKLYIDYEGKYVKKGAPITAIYSPDIVAAQEELLLFHNIDNNKSGAYSDLLEKDKNRLVESAKQRLKYWDITSRQIDGIIKSKQISRTMSIYSPYEGYVVKKLVTEGMQVRAGETLFQIADLSNVWIIADIYEQDSPYIKQGLEAKISLTNFPDKSFPSRIDYIYPELSAKTRTLKVRFPVSNEDSLLKPGMYTEIITSFDIGERLLVPSDAVIDDGVKKVVFVKQEEGKFQPKEVSIGIKTGDYYVVLNGLDDADVVVRGANFLLESEAQLKGIKPLKENQ
ncbi:cation efflux system protein [Candidatus Magnetoovum chiemensis]|nr:cation efflux system protein [Candidatus Magnetoovum chiemensis]